MMNSDVKPICMTEEFWASTQFSVARYYGGVKVNGHEFVIVNKEGKDIFECSREAARAGRVKAIEPGEPADLCRKDFVTYYRRLGREKFLEVLKFYPHADDKQLKQHMKNLIAEKPLIVEKKGSIHELKEQELTFKEL